jgi:phospholipid/cholesterol/gamma-HCH transport system permease protein
MTLVLRHVTRLVGALPFTPWRDTLTLAMRTLVSTMPVAMVVCFFASAMLTIQVASSMVNLGSVGMTGVVVAFGGVREVFPLLAAGALSARAGADIGSTVATLRSSHQWSALLAMGASPYRLIVAPRVVACVLVAPVCVLAGTIAGLLGAYVVGFLQLGIDRGEMFTRLASAVSMADVLGGQVRGLLVGAVCGVVSTFHGVAAGTDARDVGRAANRAVVQSMVVAAVVNLTFSLLAYR